MPRLPLAVLPLLLSVALPADAASPPGPAGPLEGSSWTLSALPGRTLADGASVTVQVRRGTLEGSDGCNRYRAPLLPASEGFGLARGIVSTRMACEEPLMEQATAFHGALESARALRPAGTTLELVDAEGRPVATLQAERRPFTGEFRYLADAARFRACDDATGLPVAMEAAYLELERAYGATGAAGAPVGVRLEGAVVPRPAAEGDRLDPALRVERVIAVEGPGCGGGAPPISPR